MFFICPILVVNCTLHSEKVTNVAYTGIGIGISHQVCIHKKFFCGNLEVHSSQDYNRSKKHQRMVAFLKGSLYVWFVFNCT
jgi:hypothetical protein